MPHLDYCLKMDLKIVNLSFDVTPSDHLFGLTNIQTTPGLTKI